VQEPPVERNIDPTGPRATRVVGEAARPDDGDPTWVVREKACDSLAKLVAANRRQRRRVVRVLPDQDGWDVRTGHDHRGGASEGVGDATARALGMRLRAELGAERDVEPFPGYQLVQ